MSGRAVRLDKVKRPAGVFAFDMTLVAEDAGGVWLYYPTGSSWRAPHDTGTMPFDALIQLAPGQPFVTWWVDDPSDRRIEIDVCLPPTPTETGWAFIDLELDPVRHERTGVIEVEDRDEFEDSCEQEWMSHQEAAIATTAAAEMEAALSRRLEPWGDEGWRRLDRLRCQMGELKLRRVGEDGWQLWREVRLRALTEASDAFSSSLADWQGAADSEERWRSRLRNVPLNVIAEVDGRTVGQASGTALDDDETVELISMWVAPAARGIGVGDALVNEIVRWAEEQRAVAVTLAVRTDNGYAIRLYERTGFRRVDTPADPGEQAMSRRAVR